MTAQLEILSTTKNNQNLWKMNVFEKLYKEFKIKYGGPKGQWRLWCKRPKTERERARIIARGGL